MSDILSFPTRPNTNIKMPALLIERGFSLRNANDGDIPSLRTVYADTRSEELAGVPWPLAMKQQFLDQQFNLQHQHYLKYYAEAEFLVIEHKNTVQGRYYLLRRAPEYLIVDISLLSARRGQGIGRALIESSQHEAETLGLGMQLQVLEHNVRARKLYERLGFIVTASADMYLHMRWPSSNAGH
jgi:ribosomal protein S18 acetylase RimI-like enzyme